MSNDKKKKIGEEFFRFGPYSIIFVLVHADNTHVDSVYI